MANCWVMFLATACICTSFLVCPSTNIPKVFSIVFIDVSWYRFNTQSANLQLTQTLERPSREHVGYKLNDLNFPGILSFSRVSKFSLRCFSLSGCRKRTKNNFLPLSCSNFVYEGLRADAKRSQVCCGASQKRSQASLMLSMLSSL